MRPIIYPYKMSSRSTRVLCRELRRLRCIRVYPNRRYRYNRNHLIINWGNSHPPEWRIDSRTGYRININWLNTPNAISVAQNKLRAYQAMEGQVSIPEFTTNWAEAADWLTGGITVIERTVLNGHKGVGMTLKIPQNGDDPAQINPRCPLFVKYIKKRDEYRIHVFRGQVMDFQQKRVRENSEGNNFQIRNYNNGWVYCRENVNPPQEVLQQAISAVNTLGLDFGAVDIGWNHHYQQATVYEVNTAPGLYGTTLNRYAQAIRRLCTND